MNIVFYLQYSSFVVSVVMMDQASIKNAIDWRSKGNRLTHNTTNIKAGVHLKAVFPPLNLGLMRIPRSPFKQSKNSLLISQRYVLR